MVASNIIGERVGFMKEGALADIIIVDYKPSTPITSENFMAHLLFGIDCNSVDTVIIDGKIIMEDKVLKTVYEQDVYEKTLKMAEKVWSKMRS
jgi:cytosine/adenosine deaminase-related metal-dependent hydrolase